MFSRFVLECLPQGTATGRRMRGASTVMRWLALGACLWLAWFAPAYAQGGQAGKPFDPKSVQIRIDHGIELPWGKPGFRISVKGWIPDEAIAVYAISPTGEKIPLAPMESPLKAGGNGDMTVDVDYGRKGLGPGHWVFLVAGKAGAHIVQTDLPRVEPPTKERQTWRLNFDAPEPARK